MLELVGDHRRRHAVHEPGPADVAVDDPVRIGRQQVEQLPVVASGATGEFRRVEQREEIPIVEEARHVRLGFVRRQRVHRRREQQQDLLVLVDVRRRAEVLDLEGVHERVEARREPLKVRRGEAAGGILRVGQDDRPRPDRDDARRAVRNLVAGLHPHVEGHEIPDLRDGRRPAARHPARQSGARRERGARRAESSGESLAGARVESHPEADVEHGFGCARTHRRWPVRGRQDRRGRRGDGTGRARARRGQGVAELGGACREVGADHDENVLRTVGTSLERHWRGGAQGGRLTGDQRPIRIGPWTYGIVRAAGCQEEAGDGPTRGRDAPSASLDHRHRSPFGEPCGS